MSYNGSGVFLVNSAGQPVSASTLIEASVFNAFTADVATALSSVIVRDGQTTVTADLPMATYRHTGVGNASARTDYAAAGQVQDGKLNWVDGGGTADAITATYSPAITALVNGQLCFVRATAANATTTPTFAPNGLTARTIVRNGGAALVAGSIIGDGHELILRYDLTNTRWELLNTQSVIGTDVQAYDADTAKTDVAQTWTAVQALKGTTTNDSAATGQVGEYVESVVASGSAVSLTTAIAANVTSISLTAGDWDVFGVVLFIPAGTTSVATFIGGSNINSATIPNERGQHNYSSYVAGGAVFGIPIPTSRISIASTTTVYLIAYASFTVSTMTAHGRISARRVR